MNSEKEILDEFDQLIRTENLDGLLPFLQKKSGLHSEALQKHIMEAGTYWLKYITLESGVNPEELGTLLRGGYAGYRATKQQRAIIEWSGMVLKDKIELESWYSDYYFGLLRQLNDSPVYAEILKWAKLRWIESCLFQEQQRTFRVLPYMALRRLEQLGLISYQPAMIARSLSVFDHWKHPIQLSKQEVITHLDHFLEDPIAYQRDIPQLFIYETWLTHYSVGHKREGEVDRYTRFPIWEYLYEKLLSDNKMDRRFFIKNALQIQTKDWNKDTKGFYRDRLAEIKPTLAEWIECQEVIFSFFQANERPVLDFGLNLCKRIYLQPGFNVASFLEWINPLMFKADAKTLVKNAILFLEKIAKLQPDFRINIAEIVADALSIHQMDIQALAAVCIQKLQVLDSPILQEKISTYLPQLQGNVKYALEPWLDAESMHLTEFAMYQYQVQKEKLLTQPIQLPNTWNDILFQIGKFIGSNEPHEAEILLHAFICKRHLFPEHYTQQLSPYRKQLERLEFNVNYKNAVKGFLLCKLPDLSAAYEKNYEPEEGVSVLMEKLLLLTEEKMQQQSQLPLLCQPTHLPYWIEPQVLMSRIMVYQEKNEPIRAFDLSIAIARMCREQVADAIPLVQALKGEHLQMLMKFCLGLEAKISLPKEKSLAPWMPSVQGNYLEKMALWAVAARTYEPDGVFNAFLGTDLQKEAFVVQAFRPLFHFREAWEEYRGYHTYEIERYKNWEELAIDMPEAVHTPDNLLYSLTFHKVRYGWRDQLHNQGNVFFWHSMMPQNPDPLAIRLAISSCQNSDFGDSEMIGFLSIVDRPEFRFSDPGVLTFACCFFQAKKETRLLATEILTHVIEKRKLDLELFAQKLAFLISGNYGTFNRCVEALVAIKDVSPLHNAALLVILDTLPANLKHREKLPHHFKKLLEHYLDILVKTGQKPTESTQAFLRYWQNVSSIKNLVKQILKR